MHWKIIEPGVMYLMVPQQTDDTRAANVLIHQRLLSRHVSVAVR